MFKFIICRKQSIMKSVKCTLLANFTQVYENCFGPEVVKEVRREMKIATAKCNGNMPMSVPTPNMGSLKLAMGPISTHEFGNIHHQQPQQQHQTKPQEEAPFSKTQPSIDISKLQQAILAGYNKHLVST